MYCTFEGIRAKHPTNWMLMMSEWIHPNMNGHKVIAQKVIRVITRRRFSLAGVPAPVPGIPFTLAKLARGEPVRVAAMEPFDHIIVQALREIYPNAQVTVIPWVVQDDSLPKILESAAGIMAQKPELVIVAVPATATDTNKEWFIRKYGNVYNATRSYMKRHFDCIGILPSVFTPSLSAADRHHEDLAHAVIRGHDLDPIERKDRDRSTPEQILARWLRKQMEIRVREAHP